MLTFSETFKHIAYNLLCYAKRIYDHIAHGTKKSAFRGIVRAQARYTLYLRSFQDPLTLEIFCFYQLFGFIQKRQIPGFKHISHGNTFISTIAIFGYYLQRLPTPLNMVRCSQRNTQAVCFSDCISPIFLTILFYSILLFALFSPYC